MRGPPVDSEESTGTRIRRADLKELARWQRRMITAMVGTWSFVLLFIAGEVIFDLSQPLEIAGFFVMAILVALGVVVQFSQRCPGCGVRMGLQSGVLVPESCRKCGTALKPGEGEAES